MTPLSNRRRNKMKFVDLFCGMGSFHYAFNKVSKKHKCVLACDINDMVHQDYFNNYGITPKSDICDIDFSEVDDFDCLCAGFPCQPFSNIGHKKGLNDNRGTLIHTIVDILNMKQPRFFVLENVRGLLNHDEGKTFRKIYEMLVECGYFVNYKLLKCEDYGIPQLRRRVFIVGDRLQMPNMDYEKTTTPSLSEFLDGDFERKNAFTLRCGGLNSPIGDKRNWDGYIRNGEEYRLSISDMKKLQGFDNYEFTCSNAQAKKMLGNTIPTNLSHAVLKNLGVS